MGTKGLKKLFGNYYWNTSFHYRHASGLTAGVHYWRKVFWRLHKYKGEWIK